MQRQDYNMMCDAQVLEYMIIKREENIKIMHEADSMETFFFHQGKVYAYHEIIRLVLDAQD